MSLCSYVFYDSLCKSCPYVFLSSKNSPCTPCLSVSFFGFLSNKKSVKRLIINCLTLYYVVLRGLEPRLREPKTLVLPLHHRTNMAIVQMAIAAAKIVDFSSTAKLFALFMPRWHGWDLFFALYLKKRFMLRMASCSSRALS